MLKNIADYLKSIKIKVILSFKYYFKTNKIIKARHYLLVLFIVCFIGLYINILILA